MPTLDIDFEGNVNTGTQPVEPTTPQNVTHLDGGDKTDINNPSNNNPTEPHTTEPITPPTVEPTDNQPSDSSTGELVTGDTIEFDGIKYTVDANGNLADDKGIIFKEAKDVQSWLEGLEVEEPSTESNGLDITSIQEAVGIEITDDNNQPVAFTNDAAGVKAYIDSVIDLRSQELQDGAINKLFEDVPVLKQFADYLIVNNGDHRGFGQLTDRSNITVNKENINQQKAIIRAAAREFGNPTLNDSYIKYLEESGTLYDEAVLQLSKLVEKDKAIQQEIANRAEQARREEEISRRTYFDNVKKIIDSHNIAGYKIPDTFVKEIDGKKLTLTNKDFYDYIARPVYKDANNNPITAYQRDLDAMSDEEIMNADLLQAYLKFTGSSIKDLVQMVAAENEVRKLKLRSKEIRTTKTVKIHKANKKSTLDDILLG